MAIWTFIKEANGFACISTTTSSSNSVYIFFNGGRKIKINNMLNFFNIQTSCCNWRCHKNWTSSRTKILKSYFSFSLFSVSTNEVTIRIDVSKKSAAPLRYNLKGHDSQTKVVLRKKKKQNKKSHRQNKTTRNQTKNTPSAKHQTQKTQNHNTKTTQTISSGFLNF